MMSFYAKVWLVAAVALAAPAAAPGRAGQIGKIDAALAAAGQYLVGKQADDGAWRSETYGCFRGGLSLTPHVMSSLYFLPQAGPSRLRGTFRRGVDYLAGFAGKDGRLDVSRGELLFPVYTAASASRVVVLEQKTPRNLLAQRAWLACLRARQLNERLGWSEADTEYGGWGFSMDVPRKPDPGGAKQRFFESNLAATIYGLAALRSAKGPQDDPAYRQVLVFVRRCQNFHDDPAAADPKFDDGGFFFIPDDPLQNKAGLAGTDRFGRRRFYSYGTMTADGLRALLRCGLKRDHPRVAAARRWLERNFSATRNPGTFAPDREVLREATYYYWAWAVSHALIALRIDQVDTGRGKVPWAERLAAELLRRQQPDGSWANSYTDGREDDPLVATPFAAAALAICRSVLTGEYQSLGGGCRTAGATRRPERPGTP